MLQWIGAACETHFDWKSTNFYSFQADKVLATVNNSAVKAVFPIWSIVELPNYVSQVLNRVSKY